MFCKKILCSLFFKKLELIYLLTTLKNCDIMKLSGCGLQLHVCVYIYIYIYIHTHTHTHVL